ncbi:oxygen-independent coproporphyrinogen-3 oxidase [Sphingomonas vulcanisoli]|uniref:Heme chaperone HemW n=1 Tax=Sphingomonas vulcanisoli TaxID=1658060 RepID=A0ABX0TSY0_9SPHN|nr:radical SAM family heme chaperone HemW [Sphingomonas vulcanisoli]NIJ08619.1 oxygen-independent coproporphyrinogen-3 oxidase [Sphingomonas vulcanisoli]
MALYIHWPFCVSKCPYCDFNSHVRDSVDQDQWRTALLADLAYEAEFAPRRPLTSIFFGGGTPSLMPPATAAALITAAERHWGFAPGIEITLEANPSSVEAARFADFAAVGVNRVSLGLQALDDETLRFLGRAHDCVEGLAALDVAQRYFDRVSFDLIYARPNQTPAEWEAELARALAFGTDHLSLYQLTIEPGTRFATLLARGDLSPLDDDLAADIFELTRSQAAAAGLPAYEVSNHARPGQESRHNLAYWRYADYLGIGPGAHGRRAGVATVRHRKPENWLSAIADQRHGIVEEEALSAEKQATEALLMGLRLEEGIPLAKVERVIDRKAVSRLTAQRLLANDPDRLRVMPHAMLLLEAILREITRSH